jgi:hypothetical protein
VGPERLEPGREGGAIALARAASATVAYVADADARALYSVALDARQVAAVTPLAGVPGEVLVLADGRVAVALRDRNRLQIFEPAAELAAPLAERCAVVTPAEPIALALDPRDETVAVASGWGRALALYDAGTLAHRSSVPLAREPRDVVVSDDGARAFVSHLIGGQLSVVSLPHATELASVELDASHRGKWSSQATSSQGYALAPSRRAGALFIPRLLSGGFDTSHRSATYGRGGEAEDACVGRLDARSLALDDCAPFDAEAERRRSCRLPRAAVVGDERGALFLACAGTDAVLELEAAGAAPQRERRRWAVPPGPTGLALDEAGELLVVWSQFDRQLSFIELDGGAVAQVAAPPIAAGGLPPEVARGRLLFHETEDARISASGRACATCHPDGRDDGITWSTPVGPRQTIMLAGRLAGSAPYSWSGSHATLELHLAQTFARIEGSGLPAKDLADLTAYLLALPPPPTGGALGLAPPELVARGRSLFAERGCAGCHRGTGSDGAIHDLQHYDGAFNTPSLRFVGGTAPYFHDGSAATISGLLQDGGGRHPPASSPPRRRPWRRSWPPPSSAFTMAPPSWGGGCAGGDRRRGRGPR